MSLKFPRLIQVAQHGATLEKAGDEWERRGGAAMPYIGTQSLEPAAGPVESAKAQGEHSDPARLLSPPCGRVGFSRSAVATPPQQQTGAFERNVKTFSRLPYEMRRALGERFQKLALRRC